MKQMYIYTILLVCTFLLLPGGMYAREEIGSAFNSLSVIQTAVQESAALSERAAAGDTGRLEAVIKSDFMVNSTEGQIGAKQLMPSVAIDSSGNYAVVWIDFRNGKREVYAQFYNNKDEKTGNEIYVGEIKGWFRSLPAVAANKKGDFIIVWVSDDSEIKARKYYSGGVAAGQEIIVSPESGLVTGDISVAINDDGAFLVFWERGKSLIMDHLFMRVFSPEGIPRNFETSVLYPFIYNSINSSTINSAAADDKGNFVIVWAEANGSGAEIYLQQFDTNGNGVWSYSTVTDGSGLSFNHAPQIVSTDEGRFLICWHGTSSAAGEAVLYRIYNSSGYFETPINVLGNYDGSGRISVSSDRKNKFIVIWKEDVPSSVREISSDGKNIVKYNYPVISHGDSIYSITSISNVVNNKFYIALLGPGYRYSYVYVKPYNRDITPAGSIMRIYQDNISAFQENPKVFMNNRGESIILWEDYRSGKSVLYAQLYDRFFNPVGDNFIAAPDISQTNQRAFYARSLSDGSFILCYLINESNKWSIVLKKISPEGEELKIKTVAELGSDDVVFSFNINADDEIMVSWFSNVNYIQNGITRIYNKDLLSISSDISYFDSATDENINMPKITVNKNFKVFLCWENNYSGNSPGLKGKVFNKDGSDFTGVMNICYSLDNLVLSDIALSDENDIDHAVTLRNPDKAVIIRKYKHDLSKVNKNEIPVFRSDADPEIIQFKNGKLFVKADYSLYNEGYYLNDNSLRYLDYSLNKNESVLADQDRYYNHSHFAINNDTVMVVYESNKNPNTGYDIWAKAVVIRDADFNKEVQMNPSMGDVLIDVYPNPFNSSAKIPYQLLEYHKVKLTIFDVLGREVKVLVDNYQAQGYHEAIFDAQDLPSGVYFVRLEAFNTSVKKMLLIR